MLRFAVSPAHVLFFFYSCFVDAVDDEGAFSSLTGTGATAAGVMGRVGVGGLIIL